MFVCDDQARLILSVLPLPSLFSLFSMFSLFSLSRCRDLSQERGVR